MPAFAGMTGGGGAEEDGKGEVAGRRRPGAAAAAAAGGLAGGGDGEALGLAGFGAFGAKIGCGGQFFVVFEAPGDQPISARAAAWAAATRGPGMKTNRPVASAPTAMTKRTLAADLSKPGLPESKYITLMTRR